MNTVLLWLLCFLIVSSVREPPVRYQHNSEIRAKP